MPQLTGVISTPGYEVLAQAVISQFGYGLVTFPVPAIPSNPYAGYTFAILESVVSGVNMASSGRKMYRDGAIVFVPYPDQNYAIVAIWSPNAVGRSWSLQY